jgi:hypothetical protein
MLKTTSEVIDALGGTAKTSNLMGVSMQAVSNWRGMMQFPSHTYLPLMALLRERGIEVPDSLWRMRGAA